MKNTLFALVAFLMPILGMSAQSYSDREKKVKEMFARIEQTDDVVKKNELANAIQDEMIEILVDADDFYYDFPTLDNVGKVKSDDEMIHMYTWNIMLKDGQYQYYALFQNQEFNSIHILAQGEPYKPVLAGNITENNWYGAVYYELHSIRYRDKTSYMVFGLIPSSNDETQCKVIDVMTFTKRNIKFGAPIFKMLDNKKKQSRVIFEYDKMSQLPIEFDKRKKRVIFSHLTPIRVLNDGTQIFAPDDSFDALVFKKDVWTQQEDVKVKTKKKR